jgi:hypothetical protein
MVGSSWFGGRRVTAAGAAVLLALVAGSSSAPAQAAPEPEVGAVECPTALPRTSVVTGLVGEGRTVVTGTEPQPFRVEVLGVLANGIGGGRDLVMIKVSDLPGRDVVNQGSGIWAGMSGSPVYVDGQLLGAVSYGFTSSPSPIGGLTLAADMFDVLDLGGRAQARVAGSSRPAAEVRLSAARLKNLAARAGTSAPRGSLTPLVTPLGVSGLGSKRLGMLQDQLDDAGRHVRVYAAGAGPVGAAVAPTTRPVAGGNFSAVLSSGDVTSFGVGTTTAVCGDRAVAFGHPMNLTGPVSYGAADADSLAVVEDKTLGSFKMANLGPGFGTVDQDRTAALRADLTRTPASTVVTTVIRSADNGRTRTGSTRVYDPASLPGLAADAVFAGQDAVFDEWGDGRSHSRWTIVGTRAGGRAFSVSRSNRWASQGDSTIPSAFDVAYATDQLLNNDYEDVTIDAITFSSTLSTLYDRLHITKLEVSVDGGRFTSPKRLTTRVGAKLKVRVSTAPHHSTKATTTTFAMTVPAKARGKSGALLAVGGLDLAAAQGYADEECALFGEGCATVEASSFSTLLTSLSSSPKNNALQTQLVLEGGDGSEVVAATKTVHKNLTVTGERDIAVTIRR